MSHDQAWGSAVILFALVLFAVLFVWGAVKARQAEGEADDRAYDALRGGYDGTDFGVWFDSSAEDEPTPIHDQLAAEAVIASAAEAVAAEWARAEVYDVEDDWPGGAA